mgnify:CR=1 FL=1
MHWFFKIILAILGTLVAFAAFMYAISELGGEVVTLVKPTDSNETSSVRIWIVDEGEHAWIEHGDAGSYWIRQLTKNPELNLQRDGEIQAYQASSDIESHALVHRLLQEKYGLADTLVRAFSGEADECPGLPVRLTLSSSS